MDFRVKTRVGDRIYVKVVHWGMVEQSNRKGLKVVGPLVTDLAC